MTEDKLDVLISVPNEIEAAAIVSVLSDREIQATATGGLTAGFKAEAPGEVKVLVAAADIARAAKILEKFHNKPAPPPHGSGPVIFDCESCGEQVTFAGDTRGTIQSCPECAEWLDVPAG